MRFIQVQRFFLTKKRFWGYGHFKWPTQWKRQGWFIETREKFIDKIIYVFVLRESKGSVLIQDRNFYSRNKPEI